MTVEKMIEKYHLKKGIGEVLENSDDFVYDLNKIFEDLLGDVTTASKLDFFEAVKNIADVFNTLSMTLPYGKFLSNSLWKFFYKKYINEAKNIVYIRNI